MKYVRLSQIAGTVLAAGALPGWAVTQAREPMALEAQTAWVGSAAAEQAKDAHVPLSPANAVGRRAALVAAADRALAGSDAKRSSGAAIVPSAVNVTRAGSALVQYRQEVDGVEVHGARLTVLLGRDLAARAIGGGVSTKAAEGTFRLDAPQALSAVLARVDASLENTALHEAGADGRYARYELARTADFTPGRPARIKRVWYPAADRLVPAYYAEVTGTRRGAERPVGLALLVSAEDGRILSSHSLIHDALPFTYRVFANAQGTPYYDPYGFTNPHPTGLPDGYLPTVPAPMNLVTWSHAGISTGDPWLPDGATETRGNNVDAFFNADVIVDDFCDGGGWGPAFNAAEGDFRAPVTGTRTFDYPYDVDLHASDYSQCDDLTPPPVASTQLNSKIVQMFYATNWLHDYFYDLGYDEEAGNPQTSNYGRGGIENDPLLVHAGYQTTFTFAPPDGESPSVTYGYNFWTDRRDVSAFDFGVMAHEWAHTVFGRLVVTSFYYGQEGALNEGIADFVGMFLMVRDQDRHLMPGPVPFRGAYAVGAYMNGAYSYPGDPLPPVGTPGFPDNTYYHGIRRFPSSVDFAVNPLTFKHIGVDNPLPQSANAYDWKQRSLQNSEIHTAGEVFTAALWQCSRNLLAAAPSAQFDATQRQFLAWLVAGMKLFPSEPTYTEARNALLFAIRADDYRSYLRCRSGFAERGMGAGAVSPPRHSYSLRNTVESFDDAERSLSIVDVKLEEASGADGDGVLDRGEQGRLAVTVRNTGFSPLSRVGVVVAPQFGRYDLPGGIATRTLTLQPDEARTLTLPIVVTTRRPATTLAIDVQALAVQLLPVFAQKNASFVVNYDLVRDSAVDTVAAASTFDANWTRHFTENSMHGCARGMCSADRSVPGAYADMLDWQRRTHLGENAYYIGDERMTFDTSISTVPFTVSTTAPLQLTLRHDYDFGRNQPSPTGPVIANGLGQIQISVDGGAWGPVIPYIASGMPAFNGASGGWRDDTLVFNSALAGHSVALRLYGRAPSIFYPDDAHWAISRIAIQGATTPVFSTVHGDGG